MYCHGGEHFTVTLNILLLMRRTFKLNKVLKTG